MPRIRDLGISFDPAARFNPELRYLACEGENSCMLNSACTENSQQHPCDEEEDATDSCSEGTAQCVPNSAEPERYAGGLGPEVIAQLKQHLHDRLGAS